MAAVVDATTELVAALDGLGASDPAALADGDTIIHAGQVERMVDTHLCQQCVIGIFIDLQHDMGEGRGERLRQALQRVARDRLDFLGRRGMIEAARHG